MDSKYNDLSRRALVKLGEDFDKDNNNALSNYLNDNRSEYENIRPVEAIVDSVDHAVATISKSRFNIKKNTAVETGKIVETVVGTVADVAGIVGGIAACVGKVV